MSQEHLVLSAQTTQRKVKRTCWGFFDCDSGKQARARVLYLPDLVRYAGVLTDRFELQPWQRGRRWRSSRAGWTPRTTESYRASSWWVRSFVNSLTLEPHKTGLGLSQ